MKKIALGLMLALGATAVSAQTTAKAPVLSSLADSVSYYVGQTEGMFVNAQAATLPDAAAQKYKKAYTSAMSYVFSDPDVNMETLDALRRAVEMRAMMLEMEKSGVETDPKLFMSAYNSALEAPAKTLGEVRSEAKGINELVSRASQVAKQRKEAEAAAEAEKNSQAGREFMARLKKADKKIVTTPSGLSYKVVKKGKGVTPGPDDKVLVHYTGKTIDGTVFDSSVERGEPAEFGVGDVIKGFGEGLQLMSPGAKYTLYIPAEIGYGNRGAGDQIKPGDTLIFDVELLEINPEK